MQMQAVVMAPPDGADRAGFFEDRGLEAPSLERGGCREAGGARADDDGVA
jgi:hypothetical protein